MSFGGCSPLITVSRLILTTPFRWSFRQSIVARPMAVNPIICRVSSLHLKCSFQSSVLGLKITTGSSCKGSKSILFVFLLLQPSQANARFSSIFLPPLLNGCMCSTWNVCKAYSSEHRQYSQRPSARTNTLCLIITEMYLPDIQCRCLDIQFSFYFP